MVFFSFSSTSAVLIAKIFVLWKMFLLFYGKCNDGNINSLCSNYPKRSFFENLKNIWILGDSTLIH